MGDDRFGVPDSAFPLAAENYGRDNPVRRIGMYVPTRQEVAALAPDDLAAVLDLWMGESPAELIPSYDQIRHVRSILASRPDAKTPAVQAIIAECERYLGDIE